MQLSPHDASDACAAALVLSASLGHMQDQSAAKYGKDADGEVPLHDVSCDASSRCESKLHPLDSLPTHTHSTVLTYYTEAMLYTHLLALPGFLVLVHPVVIWGYASASKPTDWLV